MSTVAEIIEAVKELPETEKGVLVREPDPLRHAFALLKQQSIYDPNHHPLIPS